MQAVKNNQEESNSNGSGLVSGFFNVVQKIDSLQGLMDGVFDASPQQLQTIMRQLDQLNRLIDDVYVLSLATARQPLLPLAPSRMPGRGLRRNNKIKTLF